MLDELGSYSLSDFLLFSQDTYFRVFELYNQDVWPAHLLAAVLGLALLILARRPSKSGARVVSAVLAVAWAWVGWAFHVERYSAINPWAIYLGGLFLVEAVLLLALGLRGRGGWKQHGLVGRIGLAVLAFGILLQPFLGFAAGRAWGEVSVFGIGPDPTATATLGILLIFRFPGRWILMVPPLLWCLASTLTAIAMDSVEGFGAAGVAVIALAAAILGAVRSRRADA